jgi:hypothetical protein
VFAELESVPRKFVHSRLEYIFTHVLYFDISNNAFIVYGRVDCAVGIATRYGLDGPEIESR